jgi:hypothetical protein
MCKIRINCSGRWPAILRFKTDRPTSSIRSLALVGTPDHKTAQLRELIHGEIAAAPEKYQQNARLQKKSGQGSTRRGRGIDFSRLNVGRGRRSWAEGFAPISNMRRWSRSAFEPPPPRFSGAHPPVDFVMESSHGSQKYA